MRIGLVGTASYVIHEEPGGPVAQVTQRRRGRRLLRRYYHDPQVFVRKPMQAPAVTRMPACGFCARTLAVSSDGSPVGTPVSITNRPRARTAVMASPSDFPTIFGTVITPTPPAWQPLFDVRSGWLGDASSRNRRAPPTPSTLATRKAPKAMTTRCRTALSSRIRARCSRITGPKMRGPGRNTRKKDAGYRSLLSWTDRSVLCD